MGAAPPAGRRGAGDRPRHGPGVAHHRPRSARTTDVPVPAAIACCDDAEVTGARVLRHELRRRADPARRRGRGRRSRPGSARSPPTRSSTCSSRSTTLDLDAIGLGDLAKRPNRLRRAPAAPVDDAGRERPRPRPPAARRPPRAPRRAPSRRSSGRPALAHGDYRFDNCVLGPDRRVAAVLDWELCTIGDPVADFCWSLMYWADPGDTVPVPRLGPDARAATSRGAPRSPAATRPARGATSEPSPGSRRSRTGRWPASSRACTPAGLKGASGGGATDERGVDSIAAARRRLPRGVRPRPRTGSAEPDWSSGTLKRSGAGVAQ